MHARETAPLSGEPFPGIALASTNARGRRTDAKTAPKVTKTVPLSCRWKRQTRPNSLCCCRLNFRVRRLNSAVLAAEQYFVVAVTKRFA
jgi:hypothetical protein